jgi:hypothetical protein
VESLMHMPEERDCARKAPRVQGGVGNTTSRIGTHCGLQLPFFGTELRSRVGTLGHSRPPPLEVGVPSGSCLLSDLCSWLNCSRTEQSMTVQGWCLLSLRESRAR